MHRSSHSDCRRFQIGQQCDLAVDLGGYGQKFIPYANVQREIRLQAKIVLKVTGEHRLAQAAARIRTGKERRKADGAVGQEVRNRAELKVTAIPVRARQVVLHALESEAE